MNEDFLQFIWNFKLFNNANLKTTSGESIEIISRGVQNKDAGPDFYNAKIKIGDTIWAGTVEIHIKSSDWVRHGHGKDNAYNNVILHVVKNNNEIIMRSNGQVLPVLEITYPDFIEERYKELSESVLSVPCAKHILGVDPFKVKFWLNRIATERLERKTVEINNMISSTKSDMEEVFHFVLFKYFGFKTNALPFEMLARSLPIKILRKYYKSLPALEALLFGQAGFLNNMEVKDEYFLSLKTEYDYLKSKHGISPIDNSIWKFSKLRPVNFPTIRIAQLAKLLNKHESLWEAIINVNDIDGVYKIFSVTASEYWDNHYVFGKQSSNTTTKKLGKIATDSLIINALSPMLFAYSIYKGDENMKEKPINFLENITAESNSIIADWIECKIKPCNALESQALIHLKTEYCSNRKCLKCAIGKQVIQNIIAE